MHLSIVNLTIFINIAYLFLGFMFASIILIKPTKFWSLIVTSIIFASGMEFLGYPIIDEFLVVVILISLLSRFYFIENKKLTFKVINFKLNFHSIIFYVLIIYLILQCFRGMLVLDDIRMIRWIAFFFIL